MKILTEAKMRRSSGQQLRPKRASRTEAQLLINHPGHALHEKGLQKQKGVGPLVTSQEQRALLVPRLNR